MKNRAREQAQFVRSLLCCDILHGLKPFAQAELQARFGSNVQFLPTDDPEELYVHYAGALDHLLQLRIVVSVSLAIQFPVVRPRALLGHQHYLRLLTSIRAVCKPHKAQTFSSFRISAAGENSRVFVTLRERLSADLGLAYDEDEGNLLLRVRPTVVREDGWEALIRLSPRPLAARAWRVFNMKGALNASIAAAMIEMTRPQAQDRFLNIMCGSGTLLIERLLAMPVALAAGCDILPEVLYGARQNIRASKIRQPILLMAMDATRLPFLDNTFDVLCADLPWGQLVGSHSSNETLYPIMLTEAARVAVPGARFVVLTHEIRLFEQVLEGQKQNWQLQEVVKVYQGGLHPRIYMLQRLK